MKIEFSADTFVGKQACLFLFYSYLKIISNIDLAIKLCNGKEYFNFIAFMRHFEQFYCGVIIIPRCRSPPVFDFFKQTKNEKIKKIGGKNNEQQ